MSVVLEPERQSSTARTPRSGAVEWSPRVIRIIDDTNSSIEVRRLGKATIEICFLDEESRPIVARNEPSYGFATVLVEEADAASARRDKTVDFVESLYALCAKDERARAIDLALNYFDRAMTERRFTFCDYTLSLLNVERLAPSVMVSILGITHIAKYHLPARNRFYDRALARIGKLKGRGYAKDLLSDYK